MSLDATTSVTAHALTSDDQCSDEEGEAWDAHIGACTGPWIYKTYDCFNSAQGPECGVAGYEMRDMVGFRSFIEEQIYIPTRYANASGVWCGIKKRREEDHSKPIYASCRHPDHGRAMSNECGAEETLNYSAPNLPRSALPTELAYTTSQAQCSTEGALDDTASPSERIAAYAIMAAESREDVHLRLPFLTNPDRDRRLAIKKTKWHFERSETAIAEKQMIALEDIYRSAPNLNACGASGVKASDAALPPDLYARLSMCYRLSLHHVATGNIKQHLDLCTPSPRADPDSAEYPKHEVQRLFHYTWTMLDRYIDNRPEAQTSPCTYCNAVAMRQMAREWYDQAVRWCDKDESSRMRDRLLDKVEHQCLLGPE